MSTTVERWVDFNNGSDSANGQASGTPWATLSKALITSVPAGMASGDTYKIWVVTPCTLHTGNAYYAYVDAATIPAGVNIVILPTTASPILITSGNLVYLAANVITGSISITGVTWVTNGDDRAVTGLTGTNRNYPITFTNCSLVQRVDRPCIDLKNGNLGAITLSGCTIAACSSVVYSGTVTGDVTLTNCTIADCTHIVEAYGNVGSIVATGGTWTAGVASAVTDSMFYAYGGLIVGLSVSGVHLTATVSGNNAGLWNGKPKISGNRSFSFYGNTIAITGGRAIFIEDINTASAAGSTLDVTISNNVITTTGVYPAVQLGFDAVGQATRATTYGASSKMWGQVYVDSNTIINRYATASAGAGSLWVVLGPNYASITCNFLKGGTGSHGFKVAAGQLPCDWKRLGRAFGVDDLRRLDHCPPQHDLWHIDHRLPHGVAQRNRLGGFTAGLRASQHPDDHRERRAWMRLQ